MVAPKPGGGWRVCGDYRRLNNATIDDKYPVKAISDFNANLAGKTIFSKIDLLKGYHQIPVNPADIPKTAVITPFGLFIFPRTPFGLKNAGQDFQRLMDAILGDLPFCFVYIDDILVASSSPAEHLRHLEEIFTILDANGLVVNQAKCVLGKTSLEFLGYRVDKHGIAPLPERIEAIRSCKAPTTVKELQRFLGMINYYRRFIPKAAKHLFHLFEALSSKPKVLEWNPDREKSFQAIKEALAKTTMLRHPRPEANLALTTDASDLAIGAVLEQRGPKGWEPLGFYSMKLNASQRKWPTFDRELLAAFRGIRHFRYMLEGRTFTIYTDHQSLVPALAKKSEPLNARQTNQLSGIAEYTTDIRYIEGKSNVVADALSRPSNPTEDDPVDSEPNDFISSVETDRPALDPNHKRVSFAKPPTLSEKTTERPKTPSSHLNKPLSNEKIEDLSTAINAITSLGINFSQMADEQPLDADFNRIRNDASSGISLRKIDIGNKELFVDVSNGPPRPFVPFSFRRQVFDSIHGLGHPGVDRTRQMMTDRFVWPSIRADVSRWARTCTHCQRAKVGRHTIPNIGEIKVPQRRFLHLHADLTTMPVSNGYKHLLTIVDRHTRWPQAIPLKDISTESVVDAFVHGWIASFGVPQYVTTDRGSQFTSAVWEQLLSVWGIKAIHTTAYHPEANGLVERFHRRLKESLMALCNEERHLWFWKLPMSLLSIRTTLKADIGASPSDLVYGEGLSIPGELLPDAPIHEGELHHQRQQQLANLRLEVERLQPTPTSAHRQPQVHVPPDLATATHVFVRRGGVQPTLASPYEGPFRVASRTASGVKVHLPGRGIEEVALARIKPAFVDEDPENDSLDLDEEVPPSPPPPGRRPGVRTRFPEPTDRQTRAQQATKQRPAAPEQAGPAQSNEAPSTSNQHDPPAAENDPAPVAPEEPARPVHRFTKESQRRFSKERPRVNLNSFANLISDHIDS